jgi:ribonucleotide reductase alpha subunit
MARLTYTKDQVKEASRAYFKAWHRLSDEAAILPANVFADKYALRDREEKFYELTPGDMHVRIANEFARIEGKYPNPLYGADILEHIDGFNAIVPQGSPMFGIGNDFQLVSLSNCAVVDSPMDNLSSIMDTSRDMANLYKRRFGCGLDIGNLRPDGASVNNAAITSTGAHSFMDHYSHVTRLIGQSGRRGALMLTIPVLHPDVVKFITKKDDKTAVTGANVSVKVDDTFMRSVEQDENVVLRWPTGADVSRIPREDFEAEGIPDNAIVAWHYPQANFTRVVNAREIFRLIAEQAAKNAEPGVLFWDTIKRNLPLDFYPGFDTVSTNPCLTGDTMILTVDGPRSFYELAKAGEDVLVYAVNKETNEPVVRWMRNPRRTRSAAQVLEIEFDSGLKVRATPDHNFIRFQNGKKISAAELEPGTSIAAFTVHKHRDGHLRVVRGVRGTSNYVYNKFVHRMVAEAVGMTVEGRVVHHIDENPENNSPENLEVLENNSEHNSRHYESRKANGFNGQYERTPEIREKISRGLKEHYTSRMDDNDFPAGALMNHKVVAVRNAGVEPVYNGTVDDVHTYIVVDPTPNIDGAVFTGIVSANCGEIPLCGNDSCRLISIYLPGFVRKDYTPEAYFDYEAFEDTVRVAMRLSDDMVDLELEKLRAIRDVADTADEKELFTKFIEKAEQGRRTGLGTHGLADTLARLGIAYDSVRALNYADTIFLTLKLSAYRESVNLAKERGPFPIYNSETELDCDFITRIMDEDPELYAAMTVYGRRNGAILTNAPTGTVSLLSRNCSSGIEPMFAISYERNRKLDASRDDLTGAYRDATGDYWRAYKVFHPEVERWMRMVWEANGRMDFEYREPGEWCPPKDQTFEQFKEVVAIPSFFVEANNINWRQRVTMQATIQRHIDHSISSTLNLPTGTTAETVAEIYMEAWQQGCKGVTVYVDGSREAQVLSTPTTTKEPRRITTVENGEEIDITLEMLQTELQMRSRAVDNLSRELEEAKRPRCDDEAHDNWRTTTSRGIETSGTMTKATFQNPDGQSRKVYVYVGKNEEGQPVETFVVDEAGDPDLIPYGAAVGKLTSLALKHRIEPNEIAEALIDLKGGSISYSGGKVYNSVPDLLAKLLARAVSYSTIILGPDNVHQFDGITFHDSKKITISETLATGSVATPTVTIPKGEKCGSCGEYSVRKVDGCPMCQSCGWSKCS